MHWDVRNTYLQRYIDGRDLDVRLELLPDAED
jgi:hypothetical protein